MDTVLQFILKYTTIYFNLGLATGLVCGALLLLRPVLVRFLSPRQRLLLWATVWLSAYIPNCYEIFSWLHILPVTFRDLITPRTSYDLDSVPMYLPVYEGTGSYHVALPGGHAIPIQLELWLPVGLFLLLAAGMVVTVCYLERGSKQLKALAVRGRLLDWNGPELRPCGLWPEKDNIRVRLCTGLPTSFVYQKGEKIDGKRYNMIYLQEELSPERRALVLRHEINHIRLHHPWLKTIVSCGLAFHWWNPLVWLAFRCTCQDLELDCDRATLEQLSSQDCREYTKTLVELGAGRQIWDAPLAFGESDGAVRVKAAVSWKEQTFYVQDAWRQKNFWLWAAGWVILAAALLFFVGGPDDVVLSDDVDLQLTEQFGSVEHSVLYEQQLQQEQGTFSPSVTIQEGWRQFDYDWFFRTAYLLSDGRWGETAWYRYSSGNWEPSEWYWLSGPPDLTQYEHCYPSE